MVRLSAGPSAGAASALGMGAIFAAGVAFNELLRRYASKRLVSGGKRVIVAVSGTIQDGFELRKNIDYRAEGEETVKAVLIGYGVVRGVSLVRTRTARRAERPALLRATADRTPMLTGEDVL
jgi:hypothetical protein